MHTETSHSSARDLDLFQEMLYAKARTDLATYRQCILKIFA